MLAALAAYECVLGCGLLAVAARWIAVPAAVFTLALFATVLLRAINDGQSACGCLGPVAIPPVVMLCLDLVAIGVLLRRFCRISNKDLSARQWRMAAGLLAVGGLAGVTDAAADAHRTVSKVASSSPHRRMFRASEWRGKPLPLLVEIESSSQLGRGIWRLVFVRAGCPACERTIAQLRANDLMSARRKGESQMRLALVAVDSDWPEQSGSLEVFHSRMKSPSWHVETPCVLDLKEGVVQ